MTDDSLCVLHSPSRRSAHRVCAISWASRATGLNQNFTNTAELAGDRLDYVCHVTHRIVGQSRDTATGTAVAYSDAKHAEQRTFANLKKHTLIKLQAGFVIEQDTR